MGTEKEYRLMAGAFDRALAAHPEEAVVCEIRLGGGGARVRFLGRRLATRLRRPLAHLEARSSVADFRIDVWDEQVCRVPNPIPGEPVSFHLQDDYAVHRLRNSTAVLARRAQHLVGSVTSADSLSLYELGRPWHAPLCIWHLDRGTPLVHSGALAGTRGAILVGGPAGSGKTTTCLLAHRAGAGYLGDDLVALEQDGSDFLAHSLYASTFLTSGDGERFPDLKLESPRQAGEGKWLGVVPGAGPDRCRITAVVLPVVSGGRSRLRPARPSEVLLRLGPSSLQVGLLSPGRIGFELLAGLAERVPGYHLELGSHVAEALGELLA